MGHAVKFCKINAQNPCFIVVVPVILMLSEYENITKNDSSSNSGDGGGESTC
jgi:hypothetical protein